MFGVYQQGVHAPLMGLAVDEESPTLDQEFAGGPGILYINEDSDMTLEVLKPGNVLDKKDDDSWHVKTFNAAKGLLFVYTRKIVTYGGSDISKVVILR